MLLRSGTDLPTGGILLFFAEYGPTLLIWLMILVLPVIFLWRRYRKALATV